MDAPRRYSMIPSRNRNGFGFYDGFEEDADGFFMQFSEHARLMAEKDARIEDLESALRVIAETEWLEDEPGGNWKPEGSEAYVEEMEAFCNWAIVFSKSALTRAALKGDDHG